MQEFAAANHSDHEKLVTLTGGRRNVGVGGELSGGEEVGLGG